MTQETELPHELLYETAESDWGVINEFIEKPGNVNAVSATGDFLITYAAHFQRWDLVFHLLDMGADINSRARNGGSVMSAAAVSENPGIVSKVLELGADIHIKGYYGVDIFSSAVSKGNVGVVSVLVAQGADVDTPNTRRRKMDPPLIEVVDAQNYEVVRVLLAAGINTKCAGNRWSMSCAIAKRDSKMVGVLLAGGFNLKFLKKDFLTGNTGAGRFDHPLVEAAKIHDLESVAKLLKAGIKADYAGNWQAKTALHYAAREGQLDMVKLLIKYGAALSYDRSEKSQFKDHELPMAGAIIGDHIEVVAFLMENGADPIELIHKEDSGFTSISLALAHKKEEIVDLFRQHCGADVIDKHLARQDIPMSSGA